MGSGVILMKRDLDYVRDLMLQLEAMKTDDVFVDLDPRGRDDSDYQGHLKIMADADLIEIYHSRTGDVAPVRLMWDGHELLDAFKSDTVWNNAKQYAERNAGTWTFQALMATLNAYITGQLRL